MYTFTAVKIADAKPCDFVCGTLEQVTVYLVRQNAPKAAKSTASLTGGFDNRKFRDIGDYWFIARTEQ